MRSHTYIRLRLCSVAHLVSSLPCMGLTQARQFFQKTGRVVAGVDRRSREARSGACSALSDAALHGCVTLRSWVHTRITRGDGAQHALCPLSSCGASASFLAVSALVIWLFCLENNDPIEGRFPLRLSHLLPSAASAKPLPSKCDRDFTVQAAQKHEFVPVELSSFSRCFLVKFCWS